MTSHLIDSFKREKHWWAGELSFRMWGDKTLRTYVYVEEWEQRPTSAQEAILDDILNRDADYRPTFATELLSHYRKNEWGYRWADYVRAALTPIGLGLKPKHMWSLIDTPSVWVPYVADTEWDGVKTFHLRFECDWDEEHGLPVEIREWQITSFHAEG